MKSPFKVNTDSNSGHMAFSPMKVESGSMYSPFKEASLSPFKLFSQSPSKGAFEDWDKDLLSSIDENLFGMGEIADNVVDELLKSPQGKAFLESRNSPLRAAGNSSVVRQLRISPDNRHRGSHFQSLNDHSSDVFTMLNNVVKSEPFEYTEMKSENTLEDHLYGQLTPRGMNSLSAIDPNKMGATPVKPGFTNVENAPKRKLSMRTVGSISSGQVLSNIVIQGENVMTMPVQRPQSWPSKERLKFARQHFKDILNQAVAKEIKLIQEEKRKKEELKAKMTERKTGKTSEKSKADGGKTGKEPKGRGKKTKTYRKKKKDTYPQIKMALSKPSAKGKHQSSVIHKNLFSATVPDFQDPAWYPSDEEDDTWTGPVPFNPQVGYDLYSEEESSDGDDVPCTYRYETISGRRVTLKRPKLC